MYYRQPVAEANPLSLPMTAIITRRTARLVVLFALFFSSSVASIAQTRSDQSEPLPLVTRAYFIENARIVVAPGEVIDRGSIVIRNGLIAAVGQNARAPSDAQRIAGDSLVVYAGFIDGLSSTGIPSSDQAGRTQVQVERPGDPPYEAAGIQPQRQAARMLSATDASIGALRNAGYAAAHVVPEGRMMPGIGALVLLGGTDAGRMVLDADASLLIQFSGTRGVYPSSDMAVLARIRQLYHDASHHSERTRSYADDPRGVERPPADDVLDALGALTAGSKPVVFYTDGNANALQIHRVLTLQQQLGFQLVLAGARQAFDVVDPIRTSHTPVVLTLDLPTDASRADTTEDASETSSASPSQHMQDFRTRGYADVDAEKSNLEARRQQERERYFRTAADLHRAGIEFAFTTRDVKPEDIHKNLRVMIEHGLSEDGALAALTINAARIYGSDHVLGTIEEGKIANLVLANGNVFNEETRIRQVFVDGIPYDVEESSRQQRPGARSVSR